MDIARYAELFRTEAREHLAGIDESLAVLADGGANAGANGSANGSQSDAIDALFRATHTIKGMAGAMGYASVEQLAHAYETLLAAVREAAMPADSTLVTLCYEAADALAQHVDDAVDGNADRPVSSSLLERLASMADSIDSDRVHRTTATWRVPTMHAVNAECGDDEPPDPDGPVPATTIEWVVPHDASRSARRGRVIVVALAPDAPLKSVRAQIVLARLEALGTVQGTEPPLQAVSDLFDGEFTIVLETSADDDVIAAAVQSAGDVARVVVRDPVARRATKDVLRNVRIDLKRLDALLDLVGELVITRDRLIAVAEASGDRTVMATAQETSRLISSLQEQILQARMVPVGQVFDRFPRLVRDVARDLGKQVSFTMEGRDIALDRSMLDAIGDPIVHLLRNAMDHGIESGEQRVAAGKPEAGRLVLRAVRDRAAIVIAVEDDGRGIDRARVLARAIDEGRVDRHVSGLSDDDLIKLLAQPGFSTAESVTAVSGRGVGIDVVANRVRALGGSMDIETVPGRGTVFSLRLPVTLAIVRALLVQVADRTYAVPSAHVMEAVEFDEAARLTLRGREAVSLRDEVLPLVRLRRVFGEPVTDDVDAQLLVVDAGGRRFACKVDALLGQQDIVVKAFDSVVGAEALFSGATILGDGSPALIVDVGSLA